MMLTSIKQLIISVVAEIVLVILAYKLYRFLMTTDGINDGIMFFNILLFLSICILAVVNYIYIIYDIELDWK